MIALDATKPTIDASLLGDAMSRASRLRLASLRRMSSFQKDCFRRARAAQRRERRARAGGVPLGPGGNNWDERSRSRG